MQGGLFMFSTRWTALFKIFIALSSATALAKTDFVNVRCSVDGTGHAIISWEGISTDLSGGADHVALSWHGSEYLTQQCAGGASGQGGGPGSLSAFPQNISYPGIYMLNIASRATDYTTGQSEAGPGWVCSYSCGPRGCTGPSVAAPGC